MDDKQNNYNLANISHISDYSFCTVREQPSQLDVDTKTCLHSTFSYPLHSTVNYIDNPLDISELTSTSKTLIDCDNTVKFNENLRESDYHSTNSSTKTNSLDSYNTLKGNEHVKDCGIKNITVLLKNQPKDRSVKSPKETTVISSGRALDNNNKQPGFIKPSSRVPLDGRTPLGLVKPCVPVALRSYPSDCDASEKPMSYGLDYDSESDCDSSCLSFDVDDLSFCDDEFSNSNNNTLSMPKVQSFKNTTNNTCYINRVIHREIAVQMWGKDQSKSICSSSTAEGNCDVCKLLRMKRQKAFTDLWSGHNGHFDDPESLMSLYKSKNKVAMITGKTLDCHLQANNKPQSLAERNPLLPGAKRKRRSSFDNTQKKKLLKTSNVAVPGDRPCPEGMEDLSKNLSASLSSVCLSDSRRSCSERLSHSASISNNLLSQSNDSGFTSSMSSSHRNDVYGSSGTLELSGNRNRSTSKAICDISSDNKENIPQVNHKSQVTPGSIRKVKVNRHSRTSKRHSPFLEAVPSPSPWKGDKKLIKRKMKQMKSASEQLNVETLACF